MTGDPPTAALASRLREQIARIIDPTAAECLGNVTAGIELWREKYGHPYEYWKNSWEVCNKFKWRDALAKADAILAPARPEPAVDGLVEQCDRRVALIERIGHIADLTANKPLESIDVETGCLRFDVCGKLQVGHISDVRMFIDADGCEHNPDDFYLEDEQP